MLSLTVSQSTCLAALPTNLRQRSVPASQLYPPIPSSLPPLPSQFSAASAFPVHSPSPCAFAVLSLPCAFGHGRSRDGNWFMHMELVLTSMHALLHQFACCCALLEYAYEVPATLLHPLQLTLSAFKSYLLQGWWSREEEPEQTFVCVCRRGSRCTRVSSLANFRHGPARGGATHDSLL